MQSPSQAENLRDSYRYPTDGSRREAEMQFAETWTPVELFDESAGGFGVRIEHVPEVAVGDVVRLRQGDKCFEVEVMHVTHCPAVVDSSAAEQDEGACQLGLKRVSEVFPEAKQGPSWFAQIWSSWHRPAASLNGKGIVLGIAIAFSVGILPLLIWSPLGFHLFGSRKSDLATDGDGPTLRSLAESLDPIEEKRRENEDGSLAHTRHDGVSFSRPSLNEQQKAVWQTLLDRAKQQTNITPWSDAVLAVISKLSEQLGLSDLQQIDVAHLLKQTDKSLAKLPSEDSDAEREAIDDKRLSILEGAYAGLMQMLTEAQQVEWGRLVEKWGKASGEEDETR